MGRCLINHIISLNHEVIGAMKDKTGEWVGQVTGELGCYSMECGVGFILTAKKNLHRVLH